MKAIILAAAISIGATASVAAPTVELGKIWNGANWNGQTWKGNKWNGDNQASPSKRRIVRGRMCRIGSRIVVINGRPVQKSIYGPCR